MRLKDIRLKRGYTQLYISEYMQVTRTTYTLWENETELIPIKRLNEFCNLCKVSFDYALGFSDVEIYPYEKKNINITKSKERLKDIRRENRHTQEYIGKKFDLNRSLLSKYEKGINIISTTFLCEYAKLYNISTDYLLGKIDIKIKLDIKVKN